MQKSRRSVGAEVDVAGPSVATAPATDLQSLYGNAFVSEQLGSERPTARQPDWCDFPEAAPFLPGLQQPVGPSNRPFPTVAESGGTSEPEGETEQRVDLVPLGTESASGSSADPSDDAGAQQFSGGPELANPAATSSPSPSPWATSPSAGPRGGGAEIKLEVAREFDQQLGSLPIKLTKLKLVSTVAKLAGASADAKATSTTAVTSKKDGTLDTSVKTELERKLGSAFSGGLTFAFKTSTETSTVSGDKAKLGIEIGIGGVAIQGDLSTDLKKPVTLTLKAKSLVNLLADQIAGYAFRTDPEVHAEFAPAIGVETLAKVAGVALVGPIGMLVYELGWGSLTAIAGANVDARLWSIRGKFASGYTKALVDCTDSPPAIGEGGDWAGTVRRALEEVATSKGFASDATKEAVSGAGAQAVYGEFAGAGPEKRKELQDRVRARAGYPPGANALVREQAIWRLMKPQIKASGPIGILG